MKNDSMYRVEAPTTRVVPAWVAVVLFLLLIFISFAAVSFFRRTAELKSELDLLQAELVHAQQDLETANSKIVGSRYIIGKSQDCIDNLIEYINPDYSDVQTKIDLAKCKAILDQAMKDTCGYACFDLYDFSEKFYQ